MTIRKELIDELIASSGGSLIGPDGLVKELTKALVERMLAGELNHHLGYEKHAVAGYGTGNSRNGKSRKTLKGEAGEMTIEVPRDRNGTFEPKLIEKHQTRLMGQNGGIPHHPPNCGTTSANSLRTINLTSSCREPQLG